VKQSTIQQWLASCNSLAYPVSVLRREYAGQERCSVARTLEIVGDRWTWLIIRDAFLGMTRFAEFRDSLGVAPNVLDDRLTRLVDQGIFERVRYSERPPRFEYRLTATGADLFTALNAFRQWGDKHVSLAPMRLLRKKDDGTLVVVALVPEGTPALSNDEIELVPGPGFPSES
jgi:DNA-binding HxlR family transcriptional regulator